MYAAQAICGRSEVNGAAVVAEIEAIGAKGLYVKTDLTDVAQVRRPRPDRWQTSSLGPAASARHRAQCHRARAKSVRAGLTTMASRARPVFR